MKIRHSLAAAVLLATAAAPVVGATSAFAEVAAPAGHAQADQSGVKTDAENRAAIEALLVYPNDYLLTAPSAYLREHAAKALAGTPEDRAHFLAVEVDKIRRDDARVAVLRIMNAGGPAVKKAGSATLDADGIDALRAFLTTGQYTARAEDENRAKVQQILDDPKSGYSVREAAKKALAGTAVDVEKFLKEGWQSAKDSDDRVLCVQIYSAGGPAVKKAALAALHGTVEDIRAFLKTGQYAARAEDENRAKVQQILDDPKSGRKVREAAAAALAGSAADVEQFLEQGWQRAQDTDDRARVAQITGEGGPAVQKAGRAALEGTIEDVRAFLRTGQYIARAEDDNRAAAQRILDDPSSGPALREAARKALAGTAADVEQFLKVGQFAARAKDKPATDGTKTVPVTNTTTQTGTTPTATTSATSATPGTLASTGTDAPLGTLAAVGGAAVALGAGALITTRRRSARS
ncbi:ALF repeat-containing protein [Kitasatospora sp. NPDC002227]|uniref:ALF repeat-containing protein n=1 Tax=Kitasatospora sp. NPDC002227 TaxID=3154773 RepID=UPI003321CA29